MLQDTPKVQEKPVQGTFRKLRLRDQVGHVVALVVVVSNQGATDRRNSRASPTLSSPAGGKLCPVVGGDEQYSESALSQG